MYLSAYRLADALSINILTLPEVGLWFVELLAGALERHG
jgi:hypothetical protein